MNSCALFFLVLFASSALASPEEKRLQEDLLWRKGYSKYARPALKPDEPVNVTFGISFQHLLEVNENGFITLYYWKNLQWQDPQLAWDSEEYGNIKETRLPTQHIWTPDIVIYQSVEDRAASHELAVVSDAGEVFLVSRQTSKIACETCGAAKDNCTGSIACRFTVSSWVHDGNSMDLHLQQNTLDYLIPNPNWGINNVKVERNVKYYAYDSTTPYVDLQYTLFIDVKKKL